MKKLTPEEMEAFMRRHPEAIARMVMKHRGKPTPEENEATRRALADLDILANG